MSLTPRQREMARHALGLPNRAKRSFRNRYFTVRGTPKHDAWMDLVHRGYALILSGAPLDEFTLTRAGADVALERGESLCPEDFPSISAH